MSQSVRAAPQDQLATMLTDERARGLAHAPGYPCLSCPARRAPRTRALSWGAPAAPRYLTIYEHGHTPCRCVDICCYTYCCTQLEDTVVASTRFQTARAIVAAQPQPAARHPRGRHRAAAAADCCHPRRRSHSCRLPPCRLRAAACASIDKLTKLQLSSFIPTFHLFLSVEFLCNYHAIWAEKLEIMQ